MPRSIRGTPNRVLWRRALARVERRAASMQPAVRRLRAIAGEAGAGSSLALLSHEAQLLREAARLANTLARMSGIAP